MDGLINGVGARLVDDQDVARRLRPLQREKILMLGL
jgi:hypothetical protein